MISSCFCLCVLCLESNLLIYTKLDILKKVHVGINKLFITLCCQYFHHFIRKYVIDI